MMYAVQGFELWLNIFTFSASTALGISVYLKNRQSWTNRLFMLLALFIDTYITVNYFSLHPPLPTPDNQLFWIRVVMFICSFIGPTLVLLVHTFPQTRVRMRLRYLIPMAGLMLASAAASLSPLVFQSIEYPGGSPVPVPGPGIPIFFLDFIGLFLVSFGILIFRYRRAVGEEKTQYAYFLFGTLISFSLMGISTVIFVVLLKTSAAVFLGPVFPVILMAAMAIAIIRHGLFDMKTVATKAFIIGIWIILFSKIFIAQTGTEFFIDLVVLAGVVFFGILLIASVNKEIAQREELSRLAASLEKANHRLKELDQQKTDFLSIASHQLRTPLSIIKGYLELIKDGAYGKPTQKMLKVLADLDMTNQRLVDLVDEFLNISRIEQGRTKYVFAPKDMDALVPDIIRSFGDKAGEKRCKLRSQLPKESMIVSMDEEKIRNVLTNFIDNAMKYSVVDERKECGDITVLVTSERGGVAVSVIDHGIGFSERDRINLFEKFYRGENVRMLNVNGTGLGLYVCKQFIAAHGGRVWAKSRGIGKGSEFGFWIPSKHAP